MRYRISVIDNWIKWYKNGKKHRLYGPAVEWTFGSKEWYKNGHYHREEGPAREYRTGTKQWRINGIPYSEEEFKKVIKK